MGLEAACQCRLDNLEVAQPTRFERMVILLVQGVFLVNVRA